LGFHNDVDDIDLQVAPYLPLEAELHAPLICSPSVHYSERHFHVAKIAKGGDEHGGGVARAIWW
jgi:hypothetical protein